jgi:hypothetical protein
MKPKTKLLFVALALLLPYMAFVQYTVLTHPNHALPQWFIYAAPCYLFGSMLVFLFARKRIVASGPPVAPPERTAQGMASARALRLLGYIWLLGPVIYALDGGLKQPGWPAVLGIGWVGLLSWACFYQARKIESRVQRDMEAGPILGS